MLEGSRYVRSTDTEVISGTTYYSKNVEWTTIDGGGTSIVQIPSVITGTYMYDGTPQGPVITGLDTRHVTITNATQTEVGTYTMTASLKDPSSQIWTDLTVADKTWTYTIEPATAIPIPAVLGAYTYDGAVKNAVIDAFNSNLITMSGTTSTATAGTYTVKFDLVDPANTAWVDGSNTQKSGTWTIAKGTQSISLSKNSVSLDKDNTSDTVTVSRTAGDGALSVSSSSNALATASLSNGTLTITGQGSGTATITVTAAETTNYAEKTESITVDVVFTTIYGAEWDGTSTTAWTRTDAAAGFVDPVPAIGTRSGSSPFDGKLPWSGMTKEARTGGVMVKIPKFWYKITQSGNKVKVQVADGPMNGFSVSPAHMNRGEGKGERDVVYVGRYHCATSTYKFETGKAPQANVTRANARTSIHNLGSNIWQSDFATRFTLWLLYIVEFADWNSQAKIGKGCGNNSSAQNMGYTDSMTYHTGTSLSSRDSYGLGTQYRWIEGLWDNVYDWCDGCYYDGNGLNIILNPSSFSDTSGGTLVGKPSSGYPSKFTVTSNGGFPVFYPTEASGSETTYSCDYWYYGASNPCLVVGGYCNQSGNHGMFFVGFNGVSSANASRGCRLLELP